MVNYFWKGQFLEAGTALSFKVRKQERKEKPMVDVFRIAPQTSRRVLKDIQRAQEDLMKEQGIWYFMDDTDITKGKALIRGPPDTPYEGCLLVFSIKFPSDYPFSPPKVLFLTSDGKTRFHPNLYVDGKVCLSILGTFSGPSWSGTQSLSSVLLSILALLDNNPLAHEPAYASGTLLDARHRDYAEFVEHQMIKLMLESVSTFEKTLKYHIWEQFEETVKEQLPSLKDVLAKKILAKQEQPEKLWGSVLYGMGGRSYWKKFSKEIPWIIEKATA
jgi:ubiquitin-conjugating enzyme E2 Z